MQITFRNKKTGEFQTFGEWCQDAANYDSRSANVKKRLSPEDASRNLDTDRATLRRAKWLCEVIDKLGLPKTPGFIGPGVTIHRSGSYYRSYDLNHQKLTLAENEKLAAIWVIDHIDIIND